MAARNRRGTLFTGPDVLASSKGATMHSSNIAINSSKVSKYVLKQDLTQVEMERLVWRRKKPDGTMEPIDFNEVLKESKFGGYQVILIIVCGIIFSSYSCSMTSLSIIIPASCTDLKIMSYQAGLINTSLLAGMILGIYIWGPLSDSLGRKIALMCCLALDFGASFICAFSVNKWMLLAFKFVNGFGIIGAGSIIFPFCGEFLEDKKRDAVLAVLEVFWIMGIAYVPAIAWGIMAMNFNYWISSEMGFVPWRLVTMMTGLPSLTGFVLLFFLPETPRFLMSTGKLKSTFEVVKRIYVINTGKGGAVYPISVRAESTDAQVYFMAEDKITAKGMLMFYVKSIAKTHTELFKKVITIGRICQVAVIDFCASFSYITLVLWLPILVGSWESYAHTGKTDFHICQAVFHMPPDEKKCRNLTPEVYMETMIISAACLPSVALLLVGIIFINKKPLLFFILILAAASSLGVQLSNTKALFFTSNIFYESFSSLVESIVILCIIDIFPVHLRGTVTALAVISARLGAITGNVLMGFLHTEHCLAMMYTFFGTFTLAAIITLTLPKMPHGYMAF